MKRALILIALLVTVAITASAQEPGWIGVTVDDRAEGGVLIQSIDPNSPAAAAGLRENDVIVEYDRQMVVGVLQLTRIVRETPAGRTVQVKVRRDGREETLQVTTGQTPNVFGTFRDGIVRTLPDFRVNIPNIPDIQVVTSFSQYGITVNSLTPQLREFFGVGSNEGVLVASVSADSAGSRVGVRAGDVIISVNGRQVSTPSEFNREMRSSSSVTTMQVVRDKQQREVRIETATPR